jgi:hypothetical protein
VNTAPRIAGVSWDDVCSFRGVVDLGFNGSGVIRNEIHVTSDEIITVESMPGHFVQDIMDDVSALRSQVRARPAGGAIVGKVPLPLWRMWRKAWEAGPKQHGVLWRVHLMGMLDDRDFSKFSIKG